MMNRRITQGRTVSGFTLLELLIALALSVIVVGAISMAVRVHLINLGKQQKRIELKQVTRNTFAMISNDLRAGIQYKSLDFGGLENLAETLALMQGVAPAEDEETGDAEDEAPIDPDAAVTSRPTFIGTADFVSVDISRVPRLHEYNPLITGEENIQLPSDIKTVSFFFEDQADPNEDPLFADSNTNATGGLYRRRIDRAVAAYREETGFERRLDENVELIAPEVARISFRYFDGEDWTDSWDSTETGGFPVAVEVTLVVDPERTLPDANRNYRFGGFNEDTMTIRTFTIHLLTAEPGGG